MGLRPTIEQRSILIMRHHMGAAPDDRAQIQRSCSRGGATEEVQQSKEGGEPGGKEGRLSVNQKTTQRFGKYLSNKRKKGITGGLYGLGKYEK